MTTTTETQEQGKAAYEALPKEQRATCDTYLFAYRALRMREGPFFYISRAALANEQGSKSISGAIKFMRIIEPMEADQPRRRRGKSKSNQQHQTSSHPSAVQSALDGVRTALEAVSKAVTEARSAADADLSAHFQAVLRDQEASFETERQADEARIKDMEESADAASDECLEARETAERLGERSHAAEAAHDAQRARADQAVHAHEIARAQLASAEEQVEVLKASAVNHSAEVSRLQGRCTALEGAAAEVPELRAENAVLRARADAVADRAERQDVFISEMNQRHERELAAIRADYDVKLAEERRQSAAREARLVARFGAPGRHEGERY